MAFTLCAPARLVLVSAMAIAFSPPLARTPRLWPKRTRVVRANAGDFPFLCVCSSDSHIAYCALFLGCWTDPNAVRLKLSDDMDDGDKLLLTALLVDVLGNPGVGVDEEGNGTKKSNL